jgi:hypothetical protein
MKVTETKIHLLSVVTAILGEGGGVTPTVGKGLSALEGMSFISSLKKLDRRIFARAIYSYLWAIRDSLTLLQESRDKEVLALAQVRKQPNLPKWTTYLVGRIMPQYPRAHVMQPFLNTGYSPEDREVDEFLPKLQTFLNEYVPTVKTPYLWMLFTAGVGLMEVGTQLLRKYSPHPPFSAWLDVIKDHAARSKEADSRLLKMQYGGPKIQVDGI